MESEMEVAKITEKVANILENKMKQSIPNQVNSIK